MRGDPGSALFGSPLEVRADELVLAGEVVEQRPLGDACFLEQTVDADGVDAFSVEEPVGRRQESFTGAESTRGHASNAIRQTCRTALDIFIQICLTEPM